MNQLSFTIKKTQMRLAREIVLNPYPQAVKEWGGFIKHFDELDSRADKQKPISSTQADDDLAAWLEHIKLDDGQVVKASALNSARVTDDPLTWSDRAWISFAPDAGVVLTR